MTIALTQPDASFTMGVEGALLHETPTGWAWLISITGQSSGGIAPSKARALSNIKAFAYSRLAYMPTDETKQACEAVIEWANGEGKC